ncbi:hypothetical protein [Novipirellula galeiformis]|uniref:hypothetical protein n=1 Tax=Novipirellula galeiformis TaxID=2528004 RepID=UPI0011B491D1|nr:hypothetical protein [Novipirellula galeiformis]
MSAPTTRQHLPRRRSLGCREVPGNRPGHRPTQWAQVWQLRFPQGVVSLALRLLRWVVGATTGVAQVLTAAVLVAGQEGSCPAHI